MERKDDKQAADWAKQVKARDNYVCQMCGKYGIYLHSHHLNSYSDFVEQRYDINNGITLCFSCHENFHAAFGKGHNTKFQFLQFCKIYSSIKQTLAKNNGGGSNRESSPDEEDDSEEYDE